MLVCVVYLQYQIKTKNIMKTLHQLQQELKDLQVALNNKDISVNYYSTMYMTISKRIKEIGG